MNIYQIEQQYLALTESIIEQGGEVTEEQQTALAITTAELQQKSVAYGYVVKQYQAETDVLDAEIKRLQAMKRSRDNTITRLKQTVKDAMEMAGITEIKGDTFKLSFRKSEAVEITDAGVLPDLYITRTVTESPNKVLIKEAIKAGATVPGAELVVNNNLQIK